MSEGIKRMLAQWEARKVAAAATQSPAGKADFKAACARIESARDILDAGADPQKWLPSELLTIGYCLLRTGGNPSSADDFLNAFTSGIGGDKCPSPITTS